MKRRAGTPQSLQLAELQQQQLREVGVYLRQHRESQQLSLSDVAQRTLVRQSILTDIEGGNLERLPEPVYIQGFIRRYASALGLDSEQVAEAFPTQVFQKVSHSFWRQLPNAQLRPVHLYVAYLLMIAASVHSLSWLMNRSIARAADDTRTEQATQLEQAVAQASAAAAGMGSSKLGPMRQAFPLAAAPDRSSPQQLAEQLSKQAIAAAPQKTAQEKKSNKPVQIKLTLTSQSWLRVMVDGKTAYEGMLSEGDQRSWEANEAVVVRAGNAGGVMVALNNQPPKPMGAPGSVEEVTYGSNKVALGKSTTRASILQASIWKSF